MANSLAGVAPEQILGALVHHYNPPHEVANPCAGDALTDILHRLPSLSKEDHVDTIHVQLQKHHAGLALDPNDHALLSFIDDAFSEILKQTDLDFKIESFIRDLAPHVAVIALAENVTAITTPQKILSLLDLIISECIGWSEDLGVLGDQFMNKIEVPITSLINGRTSLDGTIAELTALFDKEAPLNRKREQQLRDSELKVLAGQKAIYHASQLLNHQMTGRLRFRRGPRPGAVIPDRRLDIRRKKDRTYFLDLKKHSYEVPISLQSYSNVDEENDAPSNADEESDAPG